MKNKIEKTEYDTTYEQIKNLLAEARKRVSQTVNLILLLAYREIKQTLVEDEQGHLQRAEYGSSLMNE